jgi:hypothetical protein
MCVVVVVEIVVVEIVVVVVVGVVVDSLHSPPHSATQNLRAAAPYAFTSKQSWAENSLQVEGSGVSHDGIPSVVEVANKPPSVVMLV